MGRGPWVVAALITGCGEPEETGMSTEEAIAAVEAAIDGYEAWGQHEDFTGIRPSETDAHSTPFVQVWYGDTMLDALRATSATFPEGSVAVKRGYADAEGSEPGRTWVYARLPDWLASEWFWVAWNADGSLLVAGDADTCTGCHGGGVDGASLAVSY
jgi:hypothetical protein